MTQQDIEEQGHKKKNKAGVLDWFAVIAWLLLGGLFLIAWPIVMYGTIFLFDAPGERPLPILLFVLGVWCYPVVYMSCLAVAIAMLINQSKGQSRGFNLPASFYACLPMLFICVIGGMAFLGFWMMGW